MNNLLEIFLTLRGYFKVNRRPPARGSRLQSGYSIKLPCASCDRRRPGIPPTAAPTAHIERAGARTASLHRHAHSLRYEPATAHGIDVFF